jgi:cytoskeletal protein RodZ
MNEQHASLGAFLRAERHAKGLTLADLSAETKVPEATLAHIEADELDDLPGEVFVRGFLRAYARAVDVDPDLVLEQLKRPAPRPTLPLLPTPVVNLRRRRLASPALIFVLLLAAALLTVVLWRPVAAPSFSATVVPPVGGAG